MKLYVIFQLAKRSSIPKALIAEGGPHRECDGGEPTGLGPPEGRGMLLRFAPPVSLTYPPSRDIVFRVTSRRAPGPREKCFGKIR